MSTPTPTPSPSANPNPLCPLFYTILLASPLLALLPPRKLDLYTFTLGSAWVLSAEELAFGESRRARQRSVGSTGVMGVLGGADMAEDIVAAGENGGDDGSGGDGKDGNSGGEEEEERAGWVKRLWMGDEKEGWQARRVRREREELESGKGYGDIIMGQVREVFPGFGGGGGKEGEGE